MGKKLYVFYEGDDDERFLRRIIKPIIEKRGFELVPINQYARKRIVIAKFITSIGDEEYLFIKDIDTYPCVTRRKESVQNDMSYHIDINRIIIVQKEIESWYLAGTSKKCLRTLGVQPKQIKGILKSTDTIDCNRFNNYFPVKIPRSVIMDELLVDFSLKNAKLRNKSFNYLLQKHLDQL